MNQNSSSLEARNEGVSNPQTDPDITLLSQKPLAAPETTEPAASPANDGPVPDELEALAALISNEGAREVDDPDPETLTSEMPPLEPLADPPISASESTDISDEDGASQTMPFTPVAAVATPRPPMTSDHVSGSAKGTGTLAWGSRTDVGLIRDHNEDSFVIRFPLFAVADGMGGHAAGEIASTIAVSSLAEHGPETPDEHALGEAVVQANHAVIDGAANGLGRPGMGTTCTAVVIDGNTMAVGHVGDSRCYLLHAGQLVRVTHDHSYVEELVAAGEITPEEARIHPNRSVITRALGSDPSMKADHFLIDVSRGDRVLLCSDGLSSMVTDDAIEEAMVSTATPQSCADALVELALAAGGHDNVTCVVIDIKDDGIASHAFKARMRNVLTGLIVALVVLLATFLCIYGFARNTWYLADVNGYVSLFRGIPGAPSSLGLNDLKESTSIQTSQLSDAVEQRLRTGLLFDSEADARKTLEEYRELTTPASASNGTGSTETTLQSASTAKSGSIPVGLSAVPSLGESA